MQICKYPQFLGGTTNVTINKVVQNGPGPYKNYMRRSHFYPRTLGWYARSLPDGGALYGARDIVRAVAGNKKCRVMRECVLCCGSAAAARQLYRGTNRSVGPRCEWVDAYIVFVVFEPKVVYCAHFY